MDFEYLIDCQNAIPTIAEWYVKQWGHLVEGDTFDDALRRMRDYLNRDKIPFILVGLDQNDICGVAQLKHLEMGDMYPDRQHWLGGVFVPQGHRSAGLGSEIVEKMVSLAPEYDVETLNLQTEKLDGGLYARLGWNPVEQIVNDRGVEVLVMERHLASPEKNRPGGS